jgi:hypothetical protein
MLGALENHWRCCMPIQQLPVADTLASIPFLWRVSINGKTNYLLPLVGRVNVPCWHRPWRLALVFKQNSLVPKVADQIERYPQRYNIFEKKQSQETHVPDPVNGDGRAGCGDDHGAGGKEHEHRYEAAYYTTLGLEIACDNQNRCNDLGNPDNVGADIRAEQLELPADEWTVRN